MDDTDQMDELDEMVVASHPDPQSSIHNPPTPVRQYSIGCPNAEGTRRTRRTN